MYRVGELGRLFGLSRTALLYYDSIGLLRPSGRTSAGYRRYDEADRARLERIVGLRALGLPLSDIGRLLSLPGQGGAATLLKRLFVVNDEIEAFRAQQRGILDLVEALVGPGEAHGGRAKFAAIGREAGIDEDNYLRLHAVFERSSPEEHRRLLGALGFTEAKIEEFLSNLPSRP